MKKRLFILALVTLMTASGCSTGGNQSSASQPEQSSQSEEATVEEDAPVEESAPEDAGEEETPAESDPADWLEGLTKDEYADLEFTAAILERKAILPGSVVPVTVVVKNNGDKTIVYVQGSGVFETPQALRVQVDGLQPILPKDHLGIATMDFVSKELKPGESLQFVMYVLAAEPNSEFDNYTYDLYNKENQTYVGEMEWDTLQEAHPDLVAAASGSYEGHAYFRYFIQEEEGNFNPTSSATGYAQADFTVGVTG